MKKIQPVLIWLNGQNKSANGFSLRIVGDNLENSCTFYYALMSDYLLVIDETNVNNSEILTQGNITISGQDYIDWDATIDANQWAYDWAAQQLNLVLIP